MSSEIKVDTISENTSANGVAIDSVTLKDGGIDLADSKALRLGTGNDLTISFDGTDSVIDHTPGSGGFYIRGDNVTIQDSQSTPNQFVRMDQGSGVIFNDGQLDHDFRIEGNGIDDVLHVNAGNDQLCVGRQAGEGSERLSVEQSGADWCLVNIHSLSSGNLYMFNNKFTGQAPDNNVSYFTNFQDTGSIRFRVFSDGDVQNHDNSYGSTSDERIKQGIRDANSQWDDIKALKIRNYKRNDDVAQYGDKAWEQIGVIAQELEASGMDKLVKNEVLWDKDDPEVKSGDATEGDVKEYKGVKYSVLYMKAIKALQEAMNRIETLEAEVTALKGE